MFVFIANETRRPADLKGITAGFRASGPVRAVHRNGSCLIWLEDGFVSVNRGSRHVVLECRRPEVDDEAVCSIEWQFESKEIVVRRQWSGEFGAWYWRKLAVIASHLRIAALALGCDWVPSASRLLPGHHLRLRLDGDMHIRSARDVRFDERFRLTREETVAAVRKLVHRSAAALPNHAALLLSGGIDSAAIAAAARATGKRVHAFVFSMRRPAREQPESERDLPNARRVAAHLSIPLTEILLDAATIERNVPLAVQLAETPRGTIIDECAALISVAKRVRRAGYRTVLMGEAADDLLGGFRFALRLYRGASLRRYYRRELDTGLPEELAVLQNVFRRWGIAVVDPYWTRELLQLGYNLPLRFRIDRRRLMKTVLRDAFAADLPSEIVWRPKCVTRDATQVRDVLERRFGTSRERYRRFFRFGAGGESVDENTENAG